MTDKSIPLEIAERLKDVPNPRRQKVVDNIVAACEALLASKNEITPTSVGWKVKMLGLQGGPAAQTIYNNAELKSLVDAYSGVGVKAQIPEQRRKAFANDEEEILSALENRRLKSMFRDVVYERDKFRQQLRILDANLKEVSRKFEMVAEQEKQPVQTEALPFDMVGMKDAVGDLVQALEEYDFNLRADDFVKNNRPINASSFVKLAKKNGWIT